MRRVCCDISSSTRRRSTSVSGRLPIVSRKPLSTVSGVRISCETLATKSRRIASLRSRSVTSCDSSSFWPSPYGRTSSEMVSRDPGLAKLTGSSNAPPCRWPTKAGARTRFVMRCRRSRWGSRPK